MLPLKKILWPTDFSDASLEALEPAIELARQFAAEFWIIHVVEPFPAVVAHLETDISDYEQKQLNFAKKALKKIIEKRIDKDIQVNQIVSIGAPHEEIVKVSEKELINIIVIATHGETAFHKFVFGSVAEKVIRLSSRPVLVIRTPKMKEPSDMRVNNFIKALFKKNRIRVTTAMKGLQGNNITAALE